MSHKFSSWYAAQPGDTLEKVAVAFRLSSCRALLDIPRNSALRDLDPLAVLESGTRIYVPPNAGELLKERLYALQVVRPMLLMHFDEQLLRAEEQLRDGFLTENVPSNSEDVCRSLAGLQVLVDEGMRDIAGACHALAEIGRSITETHVGDAHDRSILGSTVGDMTGLYWLLSAQYVVVWADMWKEDVWINKWRGKGNADAWRAIEESLNTVRSIVVQQADARIRETIALERKLLAER